MQTVSLSTRDVDSSVNGPVIMTHFTFCAEHGRRPSGEAFPRDFSHHQVVDYLREGLFTLQP